MAQATTAIPETTGPDPATKWINAREAVQAAKAFAREIYEGEEIADLGLEELELDASTKQWYITLGFYRKSPYSLKKTKPYGPIGPAKEEREREYKQFTVNAVTGEALQAIRSA